MVVDFVVHVVAEQDSKFLASLLFLWLALAYTCHQPLVAIVFWVAASATAAFLGSWGGYCNCFETLEGGEH